MRRLDDVAWAQLVVCWLVLLGCACWFLDHREEERRPPRALCAVELTVTVACAHAVEEAGRP